MVVTAASTSATPLVSAGAGNIIINGQGYPGGDQDAGVEVHGSSGELQTTSGNITVYGTGGAGSIYDQGILIIIAALSLPQPARSP